MTKDMYRQIWYSSFLRHFCYVSHIYFCSHLVANHTAYKDICFVLKIQCCFGFIVPTDNTYNRKNFPACILQKGLIDQK